MSKLLPIVFVLIGLGAGVGAGIVLKPASEETACVEGAPMDGAPSEGGDMVSCEEEEKAKKRAAKPMVPTSFASLKKQFVVPVLKEDKVVALVVASVSLEVDEGTEENAFQKEPKLRDAFLQVLFVHAHSGGFDGDFTAPAAVDDLKERLYEVAAPIVGETLHDVLLTEILRQDM